MPDAALAYWSDFYEERVAMILETRDIDVPAARQLAFIDCIYEYRRLHPPAQSGAAVFGLRSLLGQHHPLYGRLSIFDRSEMPE